MAEIENTTEIDEEQNRNIEDVENREESHEESDQKKWEQVAKDIDEIRKEINTAFEMLDSHKRWMERFLSEYDKRDDETDDLDERDAEFYANGGED